MWPRITRNWTLATIHHKPEPYCLLLARSTNHKPDRCCIRLVRSTYYGSHPWCVVLMFSLIFLPRILQYIEFVYAHCCSHRLRMQVCVSGRLCLYCNITNEDLTFTRDFNMPASVIMHVSVTSFMCVTVYAGPNSLTQRGQKFA